MTDLYNDLTVALESIRKVTDFKPKIGIVLGSGLGEFAENISDKTVVSYGEIKGFPVSTVPGHMGRYVFGYVNGVPVVAMQGRVHYYEGYEMSQVVMPIRLMRLMGASAVLLTNACGGINPDFKVGDFMMITSQIASLVPSPLRGKNIERLGVRFPDMSLLYNSDIQKAILTASNKSGVPVKKGVYIQFSGPQFESTAEIKMASALGADAAGMSTACEAIAARHCGLLVGGISCISNMASGISPLPQTNEEVNENTNAVARKFEALVTLSVTEIAKFL